MKEKNILLLAMLLVVIAFLIGTRAHAMENDTLTIINGVVNSSCTTDVEGFFNQAYLVYDEQGNETSYTACTSPTDLKYYTLDTAGFNINSGIIKARYTALNIESGNAMYFESENSVIYTKDTGIIGNGMLHIYAEAAGQANTMFNHLVPFLVGLVGIMLAFMIVQFVINTIKELK